MSFSQMYPPKEEWDVLVIGGGAAGVFAAVSAGKTGAKTLLVEKNGVLGGTITAAGVNFPGLFHAWGKQIIDGPCWQSILHTVELGGAVLPEITPFPAHHSFLQVLVNGFVYSYVLDECVQRSGAELLLHTALGDVEETEDGFLVLLAKREGLFCVKTKVLVDATGDAAAVALAGYPRVKSQSVQPATLIHDLDGYDPQNLDPQLIRSYEEKWLREGRITMEDFQGNGILHSLKVKRIFMHLPAQEADSSAGRTQLETAARKNLLRIVQCVREIPGLEQLTVSRCAMECGVRETYRIVGEKTVTVQDYTQGVIFDDAVCYSFYPIDRHVPEGIQPVPLEPGVIPTIPYGALIPKGAKHLLVAGRCLSGDTDANSAYRVQASCMASGQAAGTAAALAAEKKISVSQVSYPLLREKLESIGAIVPKK